MRIRLAKKILQKYRLVTYRGGDWYRAVLRVARYRGPSTFLMNYHAWDHVITDISPVTIERMETRRITETNEWEVTIKGAFK